MKITFEFDSDYVDDKYSCYNGIEFVYEIDDEDIKYDLVACECKREEIEINKLDVITIMDNLYCWDSILENEDTIDFIREKYMSEAMNWYADEHYIMSEEDYRAEEADNYNDERRCD